MCWVSPYHSEVIVWHEDQVLKQNVTLWKAQLHFSRFCVTYFLKNICCSVFWKCLHQWSRTGRARFVTRRQDHKICAMTVVSFQAIVCSLFFQTLIRFVSGFVSADMNKCWSGWFGRMHLSTQNKWKSRANQEWIQGTRPLTLEQINSNDSKIWVQMPLFPQINKLDWVATGMRLQSENHPHKMLPKSWEWAIGRSIPPKQKYECGSAPSDAPLDTPWMSAPTDLPWICPWICPWNCSWICPWICPCIYPWICPWICPCICPSNCSWICPWIHPWICLWIFPQICPWICPWKCQEQIRTIPWPS